MIVGLFLAYGAAVTSLGLALATWVRRLDFAVAFNVAVLGGVTVGWLVAIAMTIRGNSGPGLAAGSPIIGIMFPTVAMKFLSNQEWTSLVRWWELWIVVYAVIAAMLVWAVMKSFDRCLGRMPERPR